MKKIKFISAIALTLVMASCDDFDLPNPPGQTNPDPEAVFEDANLEIAPATATELNLKLANAENKFVDVATISKLENFPADYDLVVEMEVGKKVYNDKGEAIGNDFSNAAVVETVLDDNVVTVNPDSFNFAIKQSNTKAPGIYTTPVRFIAYAVKGNTKMRLGGLTQTYCDEEFVVTTLDAAKTIYDYYCIVHLDSDGNVLSKYLMNNTSGSSVSPYDNPEFAKMIDVSEEDAMSGYLWKIAPANVKNPLKLEEFEPVLTKAEGCLGEGNDEKALKGKLGTSYEAGKIFIQGPVLITVNMELDSYQISYAFDVLYPLSGSTLSKPGNALLLYTNNYINYQGVSILNSPWYLCGQPDYKKGTVFKQDANVDFTDSKDGLTRTGTLTPKSDGVQLKTPVSKAQLYWIDVNLVQLSYAITCIQDLSIVGDFNTWNEQYVEVEGKAPAVKLTANKDKNVWTAEGVKINGGFKVNANGAWAVNFGGQEVPDVTGKHQYNLVFNSGDNLNAPAGTYKVTVDFRAYPYTLTLE